MRQKNFARVISEATSALAGAGIPFVVIGGIPTVIHAGIDRDSEGEDLDVFVGARDARRCIEVLDKSGFETFEDPFWIFKASRGSVTVDVIFRLSGDTYLDSEMVSRAVRTDFRGVRLPLASPEDLVVMKAIDHNEQRGQLWHDALRIVSHSKIDWEYLVRRARLGPRRVLSLLVYAESLGTPVPGNVTETLRQLLYAGRGTSSY